MNRGGGRMTGAVLAAVWVLAVAAAWAGSLDPTNAPGPTMHTLEEIYQKVDGIDAKLTRARVPATGQTTSYETGDDGDLRPGVAWPVPRFTVGTGTSSNCVTDNLTGLMWVKNPDTTERDWSTALTYCNGLDGSAGRGGFEDWRLPTVQELQSLIDYSQPSSLALPSGHPFTGVQTSFPYWSSTTYASSPSLAWLVYLGDGTVISDIKEFPYLNCVWPVRGGE